MGALMAQQASALHLAVDDAYWAVNGDDGSPPLLLTPRRGWS